MNIVLLPAEGQTHVPCHNCAQALLSVVNSLRILQDCVEVHEFLELVNLQPKTNVIRISSSYECCIGFSPPIGIVGVNSYMSLSA